MQNRLLILSFLCAFGCISQQLEIGVLRKYKINDVLISYHKGSYNVYGNAKKKHTILPTESVEIIRSGAKLILMQGVRKLGTFDTIRIEESKADHSFRIQVLKPYKGKERKYFNNLRITVDQEKGIKVVNEVKLPNYLGGVIESEGGGGRHIEYYKVQAILSRTYVLSHLKKHVAEGFNLCDQVHCQAYHNMLIYTPEIKRAVKLTHQIVMIDNSFKLANGFFFANCGGQTSESDFVWNNPVPYCKSVIDTFCIHTRQAKWEKVIPRAKWEGFLVKQFGYPIQDLKFKSLLYNFKQNHRLAFYQIPQLGIPLRDIRLHFKLKSTWFDCKLEGDQVVLNGRGFGHGVGLCQEGAMIMAKNKYSFDKILQFYFTNIGLIKYSNYLFFSQKDYFRLIQTKF